MNPRTSRKSHPSENHQIKVTLSYIAQKDKANSSFCVNPVDLYSPQKPQSLEIRHNYIFLFVLCRFHRILNLIEYTVFFGQAFSFAYRGWETPPIVIRTYANVIPNLFRNLRITSLWRICGDLCLLFCLCKKIDHIHSHNV